MWLTSDRGTVHGALLRRRGRSRPRSSRGRGRGRVRWGALRSGRRSCSVTRSSSRTRSGVGDVAEADGVLEADADSSPPPSRNNTRSPATAAGEDGPSARGAVQAAEPDVRSTAVDLLAPDDDRERVRQDGSGHAADVGRVTDAGRRAPGRARTAAPGPAAANPVRAALPWYWGHEDVEASRRTRAPPPRRPPRRRATRGEVGYARPVILPVAASGAGCIERREADQRGHGRRRRDRRTDRRRRRRAAPRNAGVASVRSACPQSVVATG